MKGITRRHFIQASAATGALVSVGGLFAPRQAFGFYQSPGIPLFGTILRGVGPGGIPVALPTAGKAPVTGVTRYNIQIKQFRDQIVPASTGLGPTTFWGYVPTIGLGGNVTPTHLGGIIIGQKGVPIQVNFKNLLNVSKHILPVDTTIPGANLAVNRTAVHLHGGLVPWISDGGPFDWFTFKGQQGPSFLNNQVLNPGAPKNSAEYYYPLNQSARFMWYHDHAVGITRLNAYAGIASAMLIRDSFEAGLIGQGLPNFIEASGNEIPLVFQDKIFVGNNILASDPTWTGLQSPGSLWYAHTYEPNNEITGTGRWDLAPGGLSLPDPSVVPEFFGDTMLVNGTTFPEVTVQARRYRLRLLNACNARFLNLQLYVDDGSADGITLNGSGTPTNTAFVNAATGDSSFLQIGTEGGFLSKPVKVPSNVPLQFVVPPDEETGQTDPSPSNLFKSLLVGPAERPDVIVDFSGYAGESVILYSDAPAPYPSGDERTDYFPGFNFGTGLFGVGNPANTNHFGFGPNTRILMRFRVVTAQGADPPLTIGTGTDLTAGIDPFLVPWGVTTPPPVDVTRFLTLTETFDAWGRLIQLIGDSAAPDGSPYEGTASYLQPSRSQTATEQHVNGGDTEVWEIYNMTGDTHPFHFHLVNVQVVNRQLFDESTFPAFINFTGPVIPPDPNELGWKETVQMYPGTVTRVIMRFDVPQILTAQGQVISTPVSPRTGGFEYVWHCHILEHEEHDMMHALVLS
jgi:spore coat protein A